MNLKKLKELEAKLSLPLDPQWMWGGIRHLVKNVDYDCFVVGELDEEYLTPDRYEGEAMAFCLNQLPALISWAERALPLLKLFLHFRNKLTDEKVAELEQLIKEAEGEG